MTAKRALVIGISDYNNLELLNFCKNDGNAMFDLLSVSGYQIDDNHNLIGYVTWEKMRDGIINFFTNSRIKPTDTLLFYYSGHGVPDVDGDVYFATSEIDINLPYKRGFSFNELAKMIQRTISTRVIVILDCCYSGAARLSKGGSEDNLSILGTFAIDNASKILKEGGKCILAASQGLQEAYALEEHNHSLFTYYLLEGLRGNPSSVDDSGYVTVDSLSKYVYNAIMSLPADNRPKQQPIRKVEASGDIVLAHYPQLAKISSSKFEPDNLGKIMIAFIESSKKANSQPAKEIRFSKFLTDVFHIEPEQLEMEVPVSSKVLIVKGRVDTVFGDLIMEFKLSVERELDDAKAKLKVYFQTYLEKYPLRRFIGIVTDNLKYIVFTPKIELGLVTDLREIDRLDIEQKLYDSEFVYLWFDSYFFASKKIIPTSIDIKRRFGVDSPTYSSFVSILSDLFAQVGMINRVNVKFANWQRYLEVVYGDKPQGTKLFIDHTYLATLSKLLIYFRISGGKPITREEVRKLVFGDIFKVYGIVNLIEEDFFTWFFYKTTYDYSTDLVFKLSKELQIYDLDALDEDVLKELYQELVGTEVRHTLGEYYTPDWLAERIVSEFVNDDPTASFLDPACGSGTFLFSIINQLIPILKKKDFLMKKS